MCTAALLPNTASAKVTVPAWDRAGAWLPLLSTLWASLELGDMGNWN